MEFNRTESAKFAQAADELMDKLTDGVEKALAENAGRGFPFASGNTLAAILAAGQDFKGKLTEANGKIYEERRGVIFQEQEFVLGLMVKIAKLAMELYREEIMNALAVEQAEVEALRDQGQADVIRLNAEVDLRQRAIIRDRAEAEYRINALKAALVVAETETLVSEGQLITAQLATAEKKLEIIDSIYQVLAAEELVLAAENRRADSLQKVLAAQQVLAVIKQEMVPYYIKKANARVELAEAITQEIPIKEAIEKLGYDRIALKDSDEDASHLIRAAEDEFEIAKETWTRANKATELARTQSRRLLQEYANNIRSRILDKRTQLEKDGVDLKLDTSLARHQITMDSEKSLTNREISNLSEELSTLLANIVIKTNAHVAAINATANVHETINSSRTSFRWSTII
jgi:hypothetical protein